MRERGESLRERKRRERERERERKREASETMPALTPLPCRKKGMRRLEGESIRAADRTQQGQSTQRGI